MEKSTFTMAENINGLIVEAALGIADYFDSAAEVTLIETDFTESPDIDPMTIPSSTNFAAITSGTPEIIGDETGRNVIHFPDPVGGWDFVSIGTGFPKTFYGYRVDNPGAENFIGCKKFDDGPVTITATGQHIVLGKVQLRGSEECVLLPGVE